MSAFTFYGDLFDLLRPKWQGSNPVLYPVSRRASVKDVLEAMGLPHTEICKIVCRGREVDFSCLVADNSSYSIYPVMAPWDVTVPSLLRPDPLDYVSFIVDINVGRLAKYMRMAGFDVLSNPCWSDNHIIEALADTRRVVLTRDMGLLKRKQVEFGRYIRSDKPLNQFAEVVKLFGLEKKLHPFSRCLECNSLLKPVAKKDVLPRLEPLTRKYYDSFSLCTSCDKLYWAGSHIEGMRQLFPQYFKITDV